ncbi:MAG: ATP-binding protein [Mycobacteriales bacterium]
MSRTYHRRIVEPGIQARLRTHGAVVLTGAKAIGKSTTARKLAASEVRLDQDRAALAAARIDPRLVLDGASPRLIDEYQLADGIWDAIRGRVDDRGEKGLFILTGSATPEEGSTKHTGVRRIAPVTMRTMTLLERDLSTGHVSIGDLLGGASPSSGSREFTVADAIAAVVMGGWPDNIGLTPEDAFDANVAYLSITVNADVQRVDNVRRNPDGMQRLLASYARNTASDAALRTIGRIGEAGLSESTLHGYLHVLKRLFLIEDQESWKPSLRSRVRLTATPKRHLADPSLAAAALGANAGRLLGHEIELAGFLFESLVIHDLRVYAEANRASVRFYRDNKGLEVDAIVEAIDGRWIAVEVKLGHNRVDLGAHNLLSMRSKLSDQVNAHCGALVVVVADSPTYVRPDGVIVTSVAALGP